MQVPMLVSKPQVPLELGILNIKRANLHTLSDALQLKFNLDDVFRASFLTDNCSLDFWSLANSNAIATIAGEGSSSYANISKEHTKFTVLRLYMAHDAASPYFCLCYNNLETFVLSNTFTSRLRLIGKVQVGTAFVSKGDNEVPFEFKTEGGSLLDDELNRGVQTRKKGEVAMIFLFILKTL
ncbi:hypothetical protein Tco_0937421 [Tanacetum coccineum]|uniref:Uncharacterized protein n=1 Tax=Tanacetum coccineum TaxID=301880 RepID=A0ABQ5DE68_9ASTR